MAREIDWLRLLQVMLVLVGVAFALQFLLSDYLPVGRIWSSSFLLTAFLQLALRYSLQQLVARHHRRGIALVKQQEWAAALTEFKASAAFFERYPWVDTLRQFTLLSASLLSYREMALVNQAFCYTQLGQGPAARQLYEQTLVEFPDSALAPAGLRVLNAGRATLSGE